MKKFTRQQGVPGIVTNLFLASHVGFGLVPNFDNDPSASKMLPTSRVVKINPIFCLKGHNLEHPRYNPAGIPSHDPSFIKGLPDPLIHPELCSLWREFYRQYLTKGSCINDVPQFWVILKHSPPSAHFLVLGLEYCCHKIFDLFPPKAVTSFIDDP